LSSAVLRKIEGLPRTPVRTGSARQAFFREHAKKEAVLSQLSAYMFFVVRQKLCLSTLAADAGATKASCAQSAQWLYRPELLFSRGLERKPVSLFWFRLFWPLVWQKSGSCRWCNRGICCFYSRELVEALAEMIASGSCHGNRRWSGT
jgi:hypothetical protein